MGVNVNLKTLFNLKNKKFKCKKCGKYFSFEIDDEDIEDWMEDGRKKDMYADCKNCDAEYKAELNVKSFIDNIEEY